MTTTETARLVIPEKKSKSQWIIFSLLGSITLVSGLVYSLQAPFYPIEAEKKGVSVVEVGFIYAVYELTSFIVAPVAGTLMARIGPVAGLHWGILLTGIGVLAVGFLDFVKDPTLFIIFSIVLRIIQAIGATSRAIAIVSMVTFSFQNAVATTFASIESFFGVGVCSGVLLAGYLMELIGFKGTFIVSGGLLLLTLPISMVVLSKYEVASQFKVHNHDPNTITNSDTKINIFTLLKVPTIALSVFAVVATAISLGFTMGVLEPHLNQFKLNPIMIGLMFLFRDLAYALASPILGYLYDKIKSPYYVRLVGPAFIFASFTIIGPAPFFPMEPVVWLTSIGLVMLGIGMSSTFVSSFLFALQDAKKIESTSNDDIRIHELISGIWRSAIALGLFVGPSVAGVLYDAIGFPNESLLVLGLQIIHMILIVVCTCFRKQPSSARHIMSATFENETTPLINHPKNEEGMIN